MKHHLICGAAIEALEGAAVRTRIKLLPMGKLPLRDGRGPYFVDDLAHAQRIVDATNAQAGAQQLMIDYDHQSIFGAKPDVGGVAPAAGWLSNFTAQADGVWADVEWTTPAQQRLEAREYRYLSPTFKADPKTGRIQFIFNAAVTNTPAIDGLPAIAAQLQTQGKSMDLTALAALLGLSADATLDQVTAALSEMKAANDQAATSTKAIATALGLADTTAGDALVTAATALVAAGGKPDPTRFVPIEGLTALQAQVKDLTDERADRVVGEAVAAGLIAPALKAWATDLYRSDLKAFNAYVDKATPVITPGPRPPGAPPPGDVVALTAAQDALCEQVGWDKAKYLETLKSKVAQ